jgi:Tfp pilus assembly protein PilP
MACSKSTSTSVVVDLEQAIGYELTPGPGNKFILTLHTKAVAKNSPAPVPAKTNGPANNVQTSGSKPAVVVPASPKVAIAAVKTGPTPVPAKTSTPAPKAIAGAKPVVAVSASTPKVVVAAVPATTASVAKANPGAKAGAPKAATTTVVVAKGGSQPQGSATTKIAAQENKASAIKKVEPPAAPKPEQKKWAMTGKRDPFFSPVVQQTSGSGCSTGKKCLEIGQINVRGVVKAESGFIAVVTNSLNKAYFLHENDPVFNGFVVRITGDSVVFQETMQDKLGKPFTREVVKRITTPAV